MAAIKYLKIGGGFLWKPISEHKKLVVLLPKNMRGGKATWVRVFSKEVKKIETLVYYGPLDEDPTDMRQIWRAKKKGAEYPKNCELHVLYKNKRYAWKIKNPAKRYE